MEFDCQNKSVVVWMNCVKCNLNKFQIFALTAKQNNLSSAHIFFSFFFLVERMHEFHFVNSVNLLLLEKFKRDECD